MRERITTAGVAVRNGKALVARRMDEGAIGGKWEFPGGKGREGESVADTLRREWAEELGAGLETGEEFLAFDFTNGGVLYHLKAVFVNPKGTPSLSVHSQLAWVGREELMNLDLAPSDRKISQYLIERNIVT